MRRTIVGAIVAASFGLPVAASAKPTTGAPGEAQAAARSDRMVRPHSLSANTRAEGSLGAGMDAGNDPGHVTGPGNAPIDNSTRGPLNDVQPGRGSADTHQSKNPKPVP